VTLTRLRDSSERLAVAVEAHPTLLFYGTAPDAAGRVMLTGCSFLASGVDGWNEFLADAAGEAVFSADDGGAARFFLTQPLETGEISFARLRRADTRLTGERAVSVLSNRRERLRALADWMKEQPGAPAFKSRREFEAYWKPVLLPETVPARKRPADWQKTDAEWVFAEETRWNAAYTKRLFPEALQPLRDTGALLRDWEEAAAWLYLEYDWDNVVQSLTEGLTLTKTRK
jgi:hypothetical protein